MADQVTIIVSTFDKYAASWPAFCHGMDKYWPGCIWPIYFTTYDLDPPCFEAIKCPPEYSTWSMMMRYALERVETPLFMFLHDDYWLVERPDDPFLFRCVDIMMNDPDVRHIQLCPSWNVMKTSGPYEDDDRFLVVAEDSDYRSSNQASLWYTQAYLDLLRDKESPWEFEVKGSIRARGFTCLSVKDHLYFKYVYRHLPDWPTEPIVKGKWTEAAYLYAEREGLEIDFSKHPGD
jgi:hypothetical protein